MHQLSYCSPDSLARLKWVALHRVDPALRFASELLQVVVLSSLPSLMLDVQVSHNLPLPHCVMPFCCHL
jgi:hypothetical protein